MQTARLLIFSAYYQNTNRLFTNWRSILWPNLVFQLRIECLKKADRDSSPFKQIWYDKFIFHQSHYFRYQKHVCNPIEKDNFLPVVGASILFCVRIGTLPVLQQRFTGVSANSPALWMDRVDPLGAKITFMRGNEMGHTAVSAIQAPSVTL